MPLARARMDRRRPYPSLTDVHRAAQIPESCPAHHQRRGRAALRGTDHDRLGFSRRRSIIRGSIIGHPAHQANIGRRTLAVPCGLYALLYGRASATERSSMSRTAYCESKETRRLCELCRERKARFRYVPRSRPREWRPTSASVARRQLPRSRGWLFQAVESRAVVVRVDRAHGGDCSALIGDRCSLPRSEG